MVVVEVPVQVVKDGEPVRGLTANDFELYDGRKKVPITGFEVLDLTAPAEAAGAPPVPVSARRHFLLLFDLSFSEPKSIVKAREAAQKVVNNLHPTDLVAVATYSSLQGPQLVIGFTPERMARARGAVERGGRVGLAIGRATPGLRTLTVIAAGMMASRGYGQSVADLAGFKNRC